MTRSSWRITVRQLESMIRLSEAMARLACSEEVQPKHVQEAYRLLNKSVIRVETPDVDLDDDAAGEAGMKGLPGPPEETQITNGVEEDESEGEVKPPPASTVKCRVTYEEYKSIANLLTLHLRHLEETKQGPCMCVCMCHLEETKQGPCMCVCVCATWRRLSKVRACVCVYVPPGGD